MFPISPPVGVRGNVETSPVNILRKSGDTLGQDSGNGKENDASVLLVLNLSAFDMRTGSDLAAMHGITDRESCGTRHWMFLSRRSLISKLAAEA